MEKKLDIAWGQGYSDVLMSLRDKQLFSFRTDADELIRTYGGKLYYQSRTGSTGNGYLDFTRSENDLVFLNVYRADQTNMVLRVNRSFKIGAYEIFVPQIVGQVWKTTEYGVYRYPIVLVNQNLNRVVFIGDYQLSHYVTHPEDLNDFEFVEKNTSFFDEFGEWKNFKWFLSNKDHYNKVDSLQFLKVPQWNTNPEGGYKIFSETNGERTCFVDSDYEESEYPFTLKTIGLVKTTIQLGDGETKVKYLEKCRSYDNYQYFSRVFENFRNPETEIHGWYYSVEGDFFYKRMEVFGQDEDVLYVFKEVRRSDISRGVLDIPSGVDDEGYYGECSPYVEYEEEIGIQGFYNMSYKEIGDRLYSSIRRKAAEQHQSYLEWSKNNISKTDMLMWMKENPDITIKLSDSLRAGNCQYGTEQFVKKFELNPEKETLGDLLEHKNFDNMTRNRAFLNVIGYVMRNQEENEETGDDDYIHLPRR